MKAKDNLGRTWMISCLSTKVITLQCIETKEFIDVWRNELEMGIMRPITTELADEYERSLS